MSWDVFSVSPNGKAVGINCTPHAETEGLEINIGDFDYWDCEDYTFGNRNRDYNKLQIGDNERLLDTRSCWPGGKSISTPTLRILKKVYTDADTGTGVNLAKYWSTKTLLPDWNGGILLSYAYYTRYNRNSVPSTDVAPAVCTADSYWVDIRGGSNNSRYAATFELVAYIMYEVDPEDEEEDS